MNHHMLRLGRLAGLSAVVAAVLATISLVDAPAATVKPDSCPTGKPLVVDSYFTAENSADYGADGHVWALDAALVSSGSGVWVGTRTACRSTTSAPSRPLPG